MAGSKSKSTRGNDANFLIAGQPVSERTFSELHVFLAWMGQFMNPRIDVHRLEREWLRLVRDPRFQDKSLRRAQAEVVIRLATGGTADPKSTGRLLMTRCLAGVGRIRQEKERMKRAKPVRRQVVAVENGDAVEDGGDLGDVGANGDQDDDDGMDVDGHKDLFGGDGGNDDDGMDMDDTSNFNDSGLPPSSPLSGHGKLPPKTPTHHLFGAGLPTPDSTPFAQFGHSASSGNLLNGKGRQTSEVERENVELRLLVKHMGAQLRDKQYNEEVTGSELLIAQWAGHGA